MKNLDKIHLTIKNLDEKDFLKYISIIISIVIFLTSFMIYRYFSNINFLKKEIKKINNARQEAQIILSKGIEVKKQKEIVDEIIKKGKNFKLLQYFDSVINKLDIAKNIKEKTITTNDFENLTAQAYSEVKLNTEFSDLNIEQLVELLDEFEKNERIYIKNLEIIKGAGQSIDVNLIIATIQPKEEITEIMG